jgi:activator of HSP90 ATPase
MNVTSTQTLVIKGATPSEVFGVFTDSRKHSKLIGAKVSITSKEGSPFSAFDGHVTGKNLRVVRNRLLVQSWRGSVWKEDDLDSILVIYFEKHPVGTQIQMTHTGLPPQFPERWNEFYWEPLNQLFHKRKKAR